MVNELKYIFYLFSQFSIIVVFYFRDNTVHSSVESIRDESHAGAVITAAITLIGIVTAADAKEIEYGRYGSPQQEVVLQLPRS